MIIRKIRILVSKGWYYVVYSISFLLLSAFCHIPAKEERIKISKDSSPKDTAAASITGQKTVLNPGAKELIKTMENDSVSFSTTEILYGAALFGLLDDDVTMESLNPDSIFSVEEHWPEFPGGEDALNAYLSDNIKYPSACRKDSVQGRVIVSFTVEKDGIISGSKIVKSVHKLLDAEALRVVFP